MSDGITDALFGRLRRKAWVAGVIVTIALLVVFYQAGTEIWAHWSTPSRGELERAEFGALADGEIFRENGMSLTIPADVDMSAAFSEFIEMDDFATGDRYTTKTRTGSKFSVWVLHIKAEAMESGTTSARLRRAVEGSDLPTDGCRESEGTIGGAPTLEVACTGEDAGRHAFVKAVEEGWRLFIVAGEAHEAEALQRLQEETKLLIYDPSTPVR
jgi:hypothetical protein